MLAAQAVRAGDARLVAAGGFESMSNVPHYLRGVRRGVKFGDQTVQDGLVHDGLWCSFGMCHMGGHAEYTAAKAGVAREDADAFALASHQKATAAIDGGAFGEEVVPVTVAGRRGVREVSVDECPRRDTSMEALAKLRPGVPQGRSQGPERPGGDRRQRPGTERRRRRGGGGQPGVRRGPRAGLPSGDHRIRRGGHRAPGPLLRPRPRGPRPHGTRGDRDRRLRTGRGERGVRGPGGGRHAGAADGPGPGQRPTAARWPWAIPSARRAPEYW